MSTRKSKNDQEREGKKSCITASSSASSEAGVDKSVKISTSLEFTRPIPKKPRDGQQGLVIVPKKTPSVIVDPRPEDKAKRASAYAEISRQFSGGPVDLEAAAKLQAKQLIERQRAQERRDLELEEQRRAAVREEERNLVYSPTQGKFSPMSSDHNSESSSDEERRSRHRHRNRNHHSSEDEKGQSEQDSSLGLNHDGPSPLQPVAQRASAEDISVVAGMVIMTAEQYRQLMQGQVGKPQQPTTVLAVDRDFMIHELTSQRSWELGKLLEQPSGIRHYQCGIGQSVR